MRLIDADELVIRSEDGMIYNLVAYVPTKDVHKSIKEAPEIDPDTLRPKGRWMKIVGMAPAAHQGRHKCSRCDQLALFEKFHEKLSDFCPHCGADMREGEK